MTPSSNPAGSSAYHLAQLNLGVFRAPLDSPEMAEFAEALDRINADADAAPGFVWRLTDDDGGPSSNVDVPGATDPLLASNLSVWTSVETLRDYMYRTEHMSFLRRRTEWFEHRPEAMTVGWWIPAGTTPTLAEALERLEHLRQHGPTDYAFALSRPRPAPDASSSDHERPAMHDSSTLIPYLTVGDARAAIAFYGEVFGAEPRGDTFETDDGRIGHAELSVRGHTLYLADDFPEMGLVHPAGHGGPSSMALVVQVDDCDTTYQRALDAGATAERPPTDQFDVRIAWMVDPWGHRWSITGPQSSSS